MRLLSIPTGLLGFLVVSFSVLASVAGLYLSRRKFSYATMKENNEVAGFVYAVVGVVYAVLLAFVVIVVWEQYSGAEESSHQEADRVRSLMRDSESFPDPVRQRVQQHLIEYARRVTEDEWERMGSGEQSPAAAEAYEQVWRVYYDFQPRTNQEMAFYQVSLERLNEMGQLRHTRIHVSGSGLPLLMWLLLIGGGVITVGFTYLFGTKNAAAQAIIVGSLAGLVGFVLFLILCLDHPFSGDLAIEPDELRRVISVWEPRLDH